MNLIYKEYCDFLKEKCGLELEEGYFWLDKQIIKAYGRDGKLLKLYRLKINDDLTMSYSIGKNYSKIENIDIETWEETVKRKEQHLLKIEQESLHLIEEMVQKYPTKEIVSLTSGGKDSSVTMHLVRQILPESKAIFNNTSLDCADTYRHIKTLKNTITINPKEGFYQWRKRQNFVPTRFSRACCTIFKEGAMVDYLNKTDEYLFFLGMRNEESNTRSNYQDEWKNNKWCDKWTGCLPIRTWSEEDIWLYILYRNISINPKYRKGYARCGCSVACPYYTKSTWVLDEYWYPTQYKRWIDILEKDFIEQGKACVLNCTKQEYLQKAWNGGRVRDEPTDEVVEEFMEYKNIKSKEIAKKYFNNTCSICGKILKKDDVGLSLKYFGRNKENLMCKKCICKKLDKSKEEINKDIEDFKQQGCTLF